MNEREDFRQMLDAQYTNNARTKGVTKLPNWAVVAIQSTVIFSFLTILLACMALAISMLYMVVKFLYWAITGA